MTAGELQAIGAQAHQDTLLTEGLTAQAELIGITARQETYGQPDTNTRTIQELRNMDRDLRAYVLLPAPEPTARRSAGA